jgi:hypothetical protein
MTGGQNCKLPVVTLLGLSHYVCRLLAQAAPHPTLSLSYRLSPMEARHGSKPSWGVLTVSPRGCL